jgi:hypothetical protein
MREIDVTLPEMAIIAGSRAVLGVGIGLLLAEHLPQVERRTLGWSLLLVGAVITVPLALEVAGKVKKSVPARWPEPSAIGV